MFTRAQIKEIAALLKAASVKDSSFSVTSVLNNTEYLAILQDGKNRRILLKELFAYMSKQIEPAYAVALKLAIESLSAEFDDTSKTTQKLLIKAKDHLEKIIFDSKDEILVDISSVKKKIDSTEEHILTNVGKVQSLFEDNLADAITGIVDASVLKGLSTMEDKICDSVRDTMDDTLEDYFSKQGVITDEEIDAIMADDDGKD